MDRFEISLLRNYYGALLTQRQNEMLVMHYDEDLSLVKSRPFAAYHVKPFSTESTRVKSIL